ncbi:lipopolysaccharide biosynthesis protein [Massilia sp. Dwa41.01b]|uniref:lipopolysaccharide biosynthesis protein n=1 Tax=unclassified Massilia TaxID=2609279 RepID=UPI0016036BBF|nr:MULTISPECIES: lipopolysaccharide biosynthesis protein [unclassified Massilia]QNA90821.1 lipopolysaccharide biosynthesis protein [Massilia sp. Dwa41.01b]QNA98061.1 lipopolysaccharide biosynthesis protein [Massilia sp. Se16.2.3]
MSLKPVSEIDAKIAKGAVWMVAFKFLDRGIGLISTLILARMLVPADFGLVAMSMILIAAMQLLVSFSFDVQLVQNPKAGPEHFNTAWTFNVIFATVCGIALAGLAIPAAQYYNEARLENILYVLALSFAIQGFSNIGTVKFQREMRFDKEFRFLLSKRLATLVVTIPLAFIMRNYWALVLGQLAGTVLSVVQSYVVSTYRPRLSFAARAEMFHASKWLVVNNVIQFVNNRAAQFIIAHHTTPAALGTHSIATEIATLPTTELVAPINRAAFPGYAKAAHDLDLLRDSFLKVISSIALFSIPAGVGIFAVADLLVPAALGWQWLTAIPLIQILAIHGVIKAVQTNITYVYLALNRPRLITIVWAVQAVFMVAVLIPAVANYGVIGASWSYLATGIVMIPVNQGMVARCLNLGWSTFCRQLVRPFIASLVMAAVVLLVKSQLVLHHGATFEYVLALLLCGAIGALTYAATLYLLWRLAKMPHGLERYGFGRVETVLGKAGIRVKLVG